MLARVVLMIALLQAPMLAGAHAQDIAGLEVCTAERDMARRTGCLQANVEYLQKLISKNAAVAQQKLDAAGAEITTLKASVAALQASVAKLQAGKTDATTNKSDSPAKPEAADKSKKPEAK